MEKKLCSLRKHELQPIVKFSLLSLLQRVVHAAKQHLLFFSANNYILGGVRCAFLASTKQTWLSLTWTRATRQSKLPSFELFASIRFNDSSKHFLLKWINSQKGNTRQKILASYDTFSFHWFLYLVRGSENPETIGRWKFSDPLPNYSIDSQTNGELSYCSLVNNLFLDSDCFCVPLVWQVTCVHVQRICPNSSEGDGALLKQLLASPETFNIGGEP